MTYLSLASQSGEWLAAVGVLARHAGRVWAPCATVRPTGSCLVWARFLNLETYATQHNRARKRGLSRHTLARLRRTATLDVGAGWVGGHYELGAPRHGELGEVVPVECQHDVRPRGFSADQMKSVEDGT